MVSIAGITNDPLPFGETVPFPWTRAVTADEYYSTPQHGGALRPVPFVPRLCTVFDAKHAYVARTAAHSDWSEVSTEDKRFRGCVYSIVDQLSQWDEEFRGVRRCQVTADASGRLIAQALELRKAHPKKPMEHAKTTGDGPLRRSLAGIQAAAAVREAMSPLPGSKRHYEQSGYDDKALRERPGGGKAAKSWLVETRAEMEGRVCKPTTGPTESMGNVPAALGRARQFVVDESGCEPRGRAAKAKYRERRQPGTTHGNQWWETPWKLPPV